jgi:hypothetical protein
MKGYDMFNIFGFPCDISKDSSSIEERSYNETSSDESSESETSSDEISDSQASSDERNESQMTPVERMISMRLASRPDSEQSFSHSDSENHTVFEDNSSEECFSEEEYSEDETYESPCYPSYPSSEDKETEDASSVGYTAPQRFLPPPSESSEGRKRPASPSFDHRKDPQKRLRVT